MPLSCPSCNRPNAENAICCAYCSASLEGAAEYEMPDESKKLAERFLKGKGSEATGKSKPAGDKSAAQKKEPSQAATQKPELTLIKGGKLSVEESAESFWVVMAPSEEPDGDTVNKMTEALSLDIFRVRNMFAAKVPWVLRRFGELSSAQKLTDTLLGIGLDVYSITSEELSKVPDRIIAQQVSLIQGGLKFDATTGVEPMELRWNGIFLIVCGKIRRKTPEFNNKKQKNTASNTTSEMNDYEVLDIYPKAGNGIRIAEGTTGFSGLGNYMNSSSLLNLRWIQRGFTEASAPIVDDHYQNQGMVFKPPEQKTLSSIMRSAKGFGGVDILDNSRHFDEYSTLLYFHHKKLGK